MPSTSETRKLVSSTRQQSQTISKFFLPKTKQKRQHHDDDEDDDQEVKPLVFTKPSSNRDGETGKGRDKEQLPGTTADNPLSIFDDDDDDDNYDVHNEDSNDEANSGKKEGDDDKLISSPPMKTAPISTTCEKEEEEEEQEEPKSTNNLFAMFAYRAISSPRSGSSSSSPSKKPRTQFNLIQGVQPSTSKSAKSSKGATITTAKTQTLGEPSKQCPAVRISIHTNRNATNKNSSKKKRDGKGGGTVEAFVRMKDLSLEEQQRITKKWQSLADPNAPLEVRRFQVLVASRLHARCQEPSVRKAMSELRQLFHDNNSSSNDGSNIATSTTPATAADNDPNAGESSNVSSGSYFHARTVAKADPEVLAHYMSNLQFYNVKAKHIVEASKQIVAQFGGIVPEDEHSLLQIIGIGKTFADLLAFVNTRKAWAATHPTTSNVDP